MQDLGGGHGQGSVQGVQGTRVARGGLRIVTLEVVCERLRRVAKFVRHAKCVKAALARFASVVLGVHHKVQNVPVVGAVGVKTLFSVFSRPSLPPCCKWSTSLSSSSL